MLQQATSLLSIAVIGIYARIVLLIVLRRGIVTWSRVQGGVAVYLLLGVGWAHAYEFVERVNAGSFHFESPPADVTQLLGKLLYFSFTTLTTVGFGDVTPVNPYARSLAIAEAVTGQLFPAILLGALVAMALQARAKE